MLCVYLRMFGCVLYELITLEQLFDLTTLEKIPPDKVDKFVADKVERNVKNKLFKEILLGYDFKIF